MKELLGFSIKDIYLSEDQTIIVFEAQDESVPPKVFNCESDCCGSCFVNTINNLTYLRGGTVTHVIAKPLVDVSKDDNCGDVCESWGYTIATDKGIGDIELRVEHNGYYGGECNYEEEKCELGNISDKEDSLLLIINDKQHVVKRVTKDL